MIDSRTIAEFLDAEHEGPVVELTGIDDIYAATESDLAFCVYDDPAYVEETEAGAVVCLPSIPSGQDRTLIRHEDPEFAFWTFADEFFHSWPEETRIHPTAVIEDGATIGDSCRIGPFVHVGSDVTIGDRCRVMAGTSIGDPGYGWVRDDDLEHTRILHSGSVVIGDRVDIGSNCSIDRSIFDANATTIADGAKICNFVHVGHQVEVGEHVEIMQMVSVSGNVHLEPRVRINPMAAIGNDITVGEGADVGLNATVLDDVEPRTRVVGTPAEAVREDFEWWTE